MTDNDMNVLTEMEADVIGEVLNISMGAAATAMSTILDKKVSITTPRIENIASSEFGFSYLEPVLGVLIKYKEGIEGTNLLLLRQEDMKKILGHLLSTDPDEISELDEISISAICEIMNQMMGSAAGALASFLGRTVNISPPEVLDTTKSDQIREIFTEMGTSLVSVKFKLDIEGLVESEFMSVLEPALAKEIVQISYGIGEVGPEEEMAPAPTQEPPIELAKEEVREIPQEEKRETPTEKPEEILKGVQIEKPQEAKYEAKREDKSERVHAEIFEYKELGQERREDLQQNENNLELIMSVPIQITVELGKTMKKIKDISDLTLGNIVELDRQAGDQVDVIANGRLIARGDVVVVDDNYSVRITEIIKLKENFSDLK